MRLEANVFGTNAYSRAFFFFFKVRCNRTVHLYGVKGKSVCIPRIFWLDV